MLHWIIILTYVIVFYHRHTWGPGAILAKLCFEQREGPQDRLLDSCKLELVFVNSLHENTPEGIMLLQMRGLLFLIGPHDTDEDARVFEVGRHLHLGDGGKLDTRIF